MRGEPGFFGSYGFGKWAGVGEAKPLGVIHELSHSYWGGFPVDGFPDLSWSADSGEVSPAMKKYHDDILAFMAQPPNDYEVLRERLRNLPEVSKENPGPLLHNLEADLVSNTGGNLALVPPILRKYWSQFLQKGSFSSWYEAVAWYKGLGPADRDLINKYLGFEHLDLRQYQSLRASLGGSGPGIIVEASRRLVEQEERQRLFDFTEQFDLLLGQAQREENFQFWRGYLRDKLALHRTHTDYLASLHLPRAPDLASALSFLTALRELSPKERALRIAAQLQQQPFLVNFLPALSNLYPGGAFRQRRHPSRGHYFKGHSQLCGPVGPLQ